jgi:hypothetical protein
MVLEFSRNPLIAGARVKFQADLCRICRGQNSGETGFSPGTYLLTYSMEQGLSTEANRLSANQESPDFMEPEGLLSHFQLPATSPYPEPARSSEYPASQFLNVHFNNILSSTPGSSKWPLSLWFPQQYAIYVFALTYTRYMPRPSHYSRFDHPNNIE